MEPININKLNKLVIPLQYDYGFRFQEGLAPVEMNKKWGCINKNGDYIIECKYNDYFFFEREVALIKKSRSKHSEIFEPEKTKIIVRKNPPGVPLTKLFINLPKRIIPIIPNSKINLTKRPSIITPF